MKTKARVVWVYAGVLLLFAALTIVMTWPVAAQMSTRLAGGEKDVWINPWATWWTRKALTADHQLYWTDHLFHPQGVSLVFHSFSHTNTALALLLEPLIGVVAAQNATTLLAYALSGFSMFALGDSLFHNRAAAFVTGLVFAFGPYHIDQVSHPVILSTQWIPLFLLFFLRVLDEGSLWDAGAAALFLALTALTSWHLFLLTALMTVLLATGELVSAWRRRERPLSRSLVGFALLCLVLLGPLMWPQLQAWFGSAASYGKANVNEKPGKSADVLAFAVPTRQHPVWGELTESAQLDLVEQDDSLYLGLVATVVLVYGVSRSGRKMRRWLMIGGVFWVLSLGPYPRLGGAHLPRLPWGVPLIEVFRASHRFHVITGLAFAVLVGWGWTFVWEQLDGSGRRALPVVATVVIAAAILFEYLSVPLPTSSIRTSPFIQQMREDPASYAVIDLPLGRSFSRYYMFQQVFHEKPIAGGAVSRTPSRANDFLESDPFWDKLLENNELDTSFQDVSRHLQYLANSDIRYMILHRERLNGDSVSEEQLRRWHDYLGMAPLYEDELILVYPTEPRAGRDFQLRRSLGEGLGLTRASVEPTEITQGGSLFVDLRWGSERPIEDDLAVCLALVNSADEQVQDDCWAPVPDWPTSDWPAGSLAIGHYVVRVEPRLPPGKYRLQARMVEQQTGQGSGEAATIESVSVDSLARSFSVPPLEHALSKAFGQQLRLLGYDMSSSQGILRVTLHWQALRRMETSYKIFVHVYHVGTGSLAAQADVVPRDWTYPTNWWEKGEVVSDAVALSSSGLASGEYRVAVGVYHPGKGERLPVQDAETGTGQSDSLILEEITLP